MEENQEWHLKTPIPARIKEEREMQVAVLTLILSRQSSYYMILLALPSSLLMILNAAAFFIPVDSGEKLSFAVTIFLAQTLNFATLADMLPASSEQFPTFGVFMVNGMGIMCSTCVSSVIGESFCKKQDGNV